MPRLSRALTLPLLIGALLSACQQAPTSAPPPVSSPTTPASAGTATKTEPASKPAQAAASPSASPSASPVASPSPAASSAAASGTRASSADPTSSESPGTTESVRAEAYRAKSPEYGLSAFIMGHADTTARDLKKITDLQFGWVKLTFPWRSIEGAGKSQYNWSDADRVVKEARAANLRIIARLDFHPEWARKDKVANGPPDNYSDYADFVFEFVSRYKQGSEFGTVDAVQIWNEVNLDREWGDVQINERAAKDYVRLLKAAYQAAKKADPGVTVITAALSPTGTADGTAQPDDVYLRWMYDAGAERYFDVLGVNANVQCPCVDAAPGSVQGFNHPSFYFRRVEQLRELMVAEGDEQKQIWLMEFGWTTDNVHPAYSWYATTEEKKAELIVQAFQFASQKWAPWIGVMTLWTISDPAWGAQDEQVWWAVTNPDGTTRPAYDRLRKARQENALP